MKPKPFKIKIRKFWGPLNPTTKVVPCKKKKIINLKYRYNHNERD